MGTMNSKLNTISRKTRRDIRILRLMTEIYCRDHHAQIPAPPTWELLSGWLRRRKPAGLCPDCEKFVAYAGERLSRCPLTPKPACRHCHIHCFAPSHRETARRIMRHGWPRIIRRGRIDLLWKVLVVMWDENPHRSEGARRVKSKPD
jgi:hypothetical protein